MRAYHLAPAALTGAVTPPPSKSLLHRILIARGVAGGPLTLPEGASEDIQATFRCVQGLTGCGDPLHLDCGESGSTLRFLIPVALALGEECRFLGRGRLMERPLAPYFSIFREQHITWEMKGAALELRGRLRPGTFVLPGNISSQFVTGLLLALPLLEGNSMIRLSTPLESRGYVDLTLAVLEQFGISVMEKERAFLVPGDQRYKDCPMEAEPDWSQGAFWYAANFLGHRVEIIGLKGDSLQGDSAVVQLAERMARPGDISLDMSQLPDLLPAAALMAAVRRGRTRLGNAARLRYKESDRLRSVTEVLTRLGSQVEEKADGLLITGPTVLRGGVTVDPQGDHRIAMMAAIAATVCPQGVELLDGGCVNKSYPSFWEDYQKLGGAVHVSGS